MDTSKLYVEQARKEKPEKQDATIITNAVPESSNQVNELINLIIMQHVQF